MSDRQLAAVGKMWPQQPSQPMRMAENWSGGRPRPGDAYSERILDGWQILSDLGAGWLLDVLDVAEEPGAHNLLELGDNSTRRLTDTDTLQSELSNSPNTKKK